MNDAIFSYLVVFKSETLNYEGPISINPVGNGTMHLFDEEMYPTLDALEFLLHMPRNIFDMYDVDENLMNASHDTSHDIILVPDKLMTKLPKFDATMVVLTDDCAESIQQECGRFSPVLGTYYSKNLNTSLLITLWRELYEHYKLEGHSVVSNAENQFLLQNEHLKALPTLFLSRQFGEINDFLSQLYNSENLEDSIVHFHWRYLGHLNTLVSLGERGVYTKEKLAKLYNEQFEKEFKNLRVNVVITFPGIPKKQKILGMNGNELTDNERRIIRIIGVHRAIACNGILIELPIVSETLFQSYDRLEEACKQGTNNKYVWRSLNNLGKEIGHYLSDKQDLLLNHAKDITVFSDFPIGVAVMNNEEEPLQCFKNISYQPLTPLTRCVQRELLKKPKYYFGESCKIAIAECIPNDDANKFIYKTGEYLLESLKKMKEYSTSLKISYKKISDIPSIIKFIDENADADILYISAHGYYDRSSNIAGIIVGNQVWMASEGIKSPPVVILSACHTAPRGIGCISIADMFLRNGAMAVLGTFIPVDAQKNLILMTRLFVYIAEAQQKNQQYHTLSDAWTGIVATNAIHELMSASKTLKIWMHTVGKNGELRIRDFQLCRCVGRLRSSHVYSDTIKILKEMLEEEGLAGKFDNILEKNDYFPESVFYQFLGNPENVFLYNKTFDEYIQRKNGLLQENQD